MKAEHTVAKILKYLFFAMVAALILLWFLGGGVGKVINKANELHFTSIKDLLNPAKGFGTFKLPWQIDAPTVSVQAVSANDVSGGSYTYSDNGNSTGSGSSHMGDVTIAQGAAKTQSTMGEYIELRSRGNAVHISGWSLESAVSGARVYIPQAAFVFVMGRVNTVSDVILGSGDTATIATGPSPVGVSFQENRCTGYLGTLQPFVPALPSNCPAPLTAIPQTAENQSRLGASCFQYLQSLPPCTFPQNPPSGLSAACKAEIQNKLSYNGCVNQFKGVSGFSSGSWRLYLARGKALWGVQHDIIRLLDENGQVVDVLNY
jgi:hypothetical protein